MMKYLTSEKTRMEILDRVANGESPSAVAKEYKLKVGNIYNWMKREGVTRTQQKTQAITPAPAKTITPGTWQPAPALKTLKQRRQELFDEFMAKMQALMLQEFTESMKSM